MILALKFDLDYAIYDIYQESMPIGKANKTYD